MSSFSAEYAVANPVAGVYYVKNSVGPRNKYDYNEARAVCQKVGLELASKEQLSIAHEQGLSVACGWTSDNTAWWYSPTWVALKPCDTGTRRWDAYCSK